MPLVLRSQVDIRALAHVPDQAPTGSARWWRVSSGTQRDLAFRVGYHNEVTSVLDELINRMSQYKPWFLKGVPLATLGLFSLGLTLLAVGSFASSLLNGGERQIKWPWIPAASLIIIAVTLWFVLG